MSSFRPDTESQAPSFIPMGFGAIPRGTRPPVLSNAAGHFVSTHAHADASDSRSSERSGRDPQRNALPAASDQAAASKLSPENLERLQAFEQAAFERGVESARIEAEGIARACDALDVAARHLERAATTSVGANRELVLALAGEIAERWLGAELSIAPERFGQVLDQAIEACGTTSEIRLGLHSEDLARVTEGQSDRVAGWQATRSIVLVAQGDLARGEFELQAGAETVDGRRDVILASLRDALSAALDVPPPSNEELST
jgi:hypothetical protein